MAKYICPICGLEIERDLVKFLSHADEHVIEVVKRQHPEWVSGDGLCEKCLDHYKQSLKGKNGGNR